MHAVEKAMANVQIEKFKHPAPGTGSLRKMGSKGEAPRKSPAARGDKKPCVVQ